MLHIPGWLLDLERAMDAIELVTWIAARVRDAYADDVDATRGGPYRPGLDGNAERERDAR